MVRGFDAFTVISGEYGQAAATGLQARYCVGGAVALGGRLYRDNPKGRPNNSRRLLRSQRNRNAFYKDARLGNDFIMIDCLTDNPDIAGLERSARALCDRRFGDRRGWAYLRHAVERG